jgi:hypothetical protein
MLPDSARKIADFKQALLSLKVAFDSGTVIQTAFVSWKQWRNWVRNLPGLGLVKFPDYCVS